MNLDEIRARDKKAHNRMEWGWRINASVAEQDRHDLLALVDALEQQAAKDTRTIEQLRDALLAVQALLPTHDTASYLSAQSIITHALAALQRAAQETPDA